MRELTKTEIDSVFGGDCNIGIGNGNTITININF
jgi:hypothetical protein